MKRNETAELIAGILVFVICAIFVLPLAFGSGGNAISQAWWYSVDLYADHAHFGQAVYLPVVFRNYPSTPTPPPAPTLLNPGFDAWEGSTVPHWYPWHEDAGDNCRQAPDWLPCRPNWWVERDFNEYGLYRSYPSSQAIGAQYGPWHGGVMQTVSVAPGTRLRFSVWARAFISNDDLPNPSYSSWKPNFQVGIDPEGKGLWYDPDIVWSAPVNVLDQWVQVSVEATAGASGKVTVFVSARMTNQQPLKHNDAWFDDAKLEIATTGP